MPKKRMNEIVKCKHFAWRVYRRDGVYYADGRSNRHDVGRHSLNSRDRSEALERIEKLDRVKAVELGLVPRSEQPAEDIAPLGLIEGVAWYMDDIAKTRVVGGVKESTRKRYRSVFAKFLPFCQSRKLTTWNAITTAVVEEYATHLDQLGYLSKTIQNEIVTISQATHRMIDAGLLPGTQPLRVKIRRAESQPAYCYRPEEVQAMIQHCRQSPKLDWMADIMVALSCTGFRISELAGLRWADIDLSGQVLTLHDETGYRRKPGNGRRLLKSGRSRSLPIHPELLKVLQQLPRNGPFVFYGPRNGRLKPDTVRNVMISQVIKPLSERFPGVDGEQSFKDGRLHSFRHFFCSRCVCENIPERIVMEWLGHRESEMIRRYFHLHDAESHRRMNSLGFIAGKDNRPNDRQGKST